MQSSKRYKHDDVPARSPLLDPPADARSPLLDLPADVWELVCTLVSDLSWWFSVWSLVCRNASQSARPVSSPALRVRADAPAIPAALWREWQEITCLTIEGDGDAVLRLVREHKIAVQAILLDEVTDQNLREATGLRGLQRLGNIANVTPGAESNCTPPLVPCESWLSNCHYASEEAIVQYLRAKRPQTLVLNLRQGEVLGAELCRVIGTMTQLRQLDLSHADVPGELGWLAALPELTYLNLNYCAGVTGNALAHIAGLPNLESLSLCECENLSPTELALLSRLHELRYLNLGSARTPDLGFVRGLTKLQRLCLSGCEVSNDALAVAELPDLRVLDLSNNPGLTDEGLASVARLKRLRELALADTGVTSAGLRQLRGPGLQKLDLGGCAIEDLKFLSGLGGLQDLTLTVGIGEELAQLPRHLRGLRLRGGPQFDGEKLRHLSLLLELRQLQLEGFTNLVPAAVRHLRRLPNLQNLRFLRCPELNGNVFDFCLTMPKLRDLCIWPSRGISTRAIEAFRARRPNCNFSQ